MTIAQLIALVTSLLSVAPELLAMIPTAAGGKVTDADVQAIFDKYGVDHATTQALIDAAKAAGH